MGKKKKKGLKLREMSVEELSKEEKELRDQVWKLRLQLSTGQLPSPEKVREARRNLARVLTAKRWREMAESAEARR